MCPLGLTQNQGGIFSSCFLPYVLVTEKQLFTSLGNYPNYLFHQVTALNSIPDNWIQTFYQYDEDLESIAYLVWYKNIKNYTILKSSIALGERFYFGIRETRIQILTDPIWNYLTCTGPQFPLKIILKCYFVSIMDWSFACTVYYGNLINHLWMNGEKG